MKVVVASPKRGARRVLDAGLLDAARTLASSHREARLRPCSLVRLPEADARAGARVWLALESLQVTGSFKVRGALLALSRLKEQGCHAVVAASAGNHGAGIAYAASILGMDATIVVPKAAPQVKRERILAYGSKLVVSDHGYDGAEHEAREVAERDGVPFVSPYDDVAVIAGNGGSLGYEIEARLGRAPAMVVAPFGGGGLATGLACALRTKVFGAQSEASPAFALSLERGEAIEELEPASGTLADGLEGGISRAAFERASSVVAGVVVVSEQAIADAMLAAHKWLGLTIEGSAAAALAPFVGSPPEHLRPADPNADIVVVLTGRNVDPARYAELLQAAAE